MVFFTALLFGFTMLTRASNYLPISSAMNTGHVAFTVAPVPGTDGSPTEVTADQLGDIPLSRILGVSTCLTHSKTDSVGRGRRIPFVRREINPPISVYDIVTVLYQYVVAVRPSREKPFFSHT